MLDACDRVGVLVMDELTDMWTESKTDFDSALDFPEWWERDVEAMVRKDLNHPSVDPLLDRQRDPRGRRSRTGRSGRGALAEKVRSLDDTRFVTNGDQRDARRASTRRRPPRTAAEARHQHDARRHGRVHGRARRGSELVAERTAESYDVLDVGGHQLHATPATRSTASCFPHRVIVGTETFPNKIDRLWRLVLRQPARDRRLHLDRLGLPRRGRHRPGHDARTTRPRASSVRPTRGCSPTCGDIDITGHRRPASYYREIVFGLRQRPVPRGAAGRSTTAASCRRRRGRGRDTVGSWSWAGAEGKPVTVEVYSDADEVELLLDGDVARASRRWGRRTASGPSSR